MAAGAFWVIARMLPKVLVARSLLGVARVFKIASMAVWVVAMVFQMAGGAFWNIARVLPRVLVARALVFKMISRVHWVVAMVLLGCSGWLLGHFGSLLGFSQEFWCLRHCVVLVVSSVLLERCY